MSKRKKKILVSLGLFLLAVPGIAIFTYTIGEPRFTSARLSVSAQKYQDAGLPWLADDIRPNPPVTPEENAAPDILQAIESHQEKSLSPTLRKIREALKQEDYQTVAEALSPHQETLALATQASQKPRLDYNRDWDIGPALLMPEYAHVKSYVQLFAARAELRQFQGNDQSAIDDLKAALRLAILHTQEPNLLAQLVCTSSQIMTYNGIARVAALRDSQKKPLDPLIALLQTHPPQVDIQHGLRGEAFMAVTVCRNLSDPTKLSAEEISMPTPDTLVRDGYPKGPYVRALLTRALDYWNEVDRVFKENPDDSLKLAELFIDRDPYEGRRFLWVSETLSAILVPVFNQALIASVNLEANHIVHLAYLDALRFRQANGKFPDSVTELDPAYIDPFNQEPLRIAHVEGQFRVYSVGRNFTDEGGRTSSEFPTSTDSKIKSADTIAPNPRN